MSVIGACELSLFFIPHTFVPPLAAAFAIAAILLSVSPSPAIYLAQSAAAAVAHSLAFGHATQTLHMAAHFPVALLFPLLLLLRPPPTAACFTAAHPCGCGCATVHAAAMSLARALPDCAACAVAAGGRECAAAALAGAAMLVTLAVASGVVGAETAAVDGAVEHGALAALPVAAALLADEPATWVLAGAAQMAVVCAIHRGSLRR